MVSTGVEEPDTPIDDEVRRAEDDRLATAANRGDRAAAELYFTRNLPYLTSIAAWLVRDRGNILDSDDLASDAIAALIALWAQGKGPESGANAYVIRSMRNRLIDEFRAPRSRVTPLEAERVEPSIEHSTREVDLHREFTYVKAALASLPSDQQAILVGTLVEGRKPGDLQVQLNRPASAIYSLNRRARVGLRRATLRVLLEENAPAECRHAAARLPDQVALTVEETNGGGGMDHVRTCARCRKAWARFGAMASTLGVCALFAVSGVLRAPAAQASESELSPPRRDMPPSRVRSAVRVVQGHWVTIVSVAALVGGLGIAALSIPGVVAAINEAKVVPVAADLQVTTRTTGDGSAEMVAEYHAADPSSQYTVTLPEGVSFDSTPVDWDCEVSASTATCSTEGAMPGRFGLIDSRERPIGNYRVEVNAEADGQAITGFAQGRIEPRELTVTARLAED